MLWGPRAGLLYTLNRANNLFAEYQYQLWGGDIGDVLDSGHMVLLGIEHKFKVGPIRRKVPESNTLGSADPR